VQRQDRKQQIVRRAANSFERVAREWYSKHAKVWVSGHAEDVLRRLERNLFPDLGTRPLAEITAPELLAAIRKIESRGAHDLAHRVLQVASAVFRYGVATGRCERDPGPDLRGALTPHKAKNQAAVKPDELPALLRAIFDYAKIGDRQTAEICVSGSPVAPLPDGTPTSREVLDRLYLEHGPIHGSGYDQARAVAHVNLGDMYATGRGGLPRDDKQALEWFHKSAEQGNPRGQAELGIAYATGQLGLPQDEKQAVELLRKAADQNEAVAQVNLGDMYAKGQGVARDDTEAVKWFRKAAEQGDALAQRNLGDMYASGRGGLPQDDKQAVEWFARRPSK
jgi:hypothetical protein